MMALWRFGLTSALRITIAVFRVSKKGLVPCLGCGDPQMGQQQESNCNCHISSYEKAIFKVVQDELTNCSCTVFSFSVKTHELCGVLCLSE